MEGLAVNQIPFQLWLKQDCFNFLNNYAIESKIAPYHELDTTEKRKEWKRQMMLRMHPDKHPTDQACWKEAFQKARGCLETRDPQMIPFWLNISLRQLERARQTETTAKAAALDAKRRAEEAIRRAELLAQEAMKAELARKQQEEIVRQLEQEAAESLIALGAKSFKPSRREFSVSPSDAGMNALLRASGVI